MIYSVRRCSPTSASLSTRRWLPTHLVSVSLPFENILSLSRRRNVLARLMQVCEDVEQEQECATVEEVTKLSIILSFNQAEVLLMLFKIC